MKQYIADAFTDEIFKGNQAAVCVMDKWPSENTMMHITMENNFSETAFMVKEENDITVCAGSHRAEKSISAATPPWHRDIFFSVSMKRIRKK